MFQAFVSMMTEKQILCVTSEVVSIRFYTQASIKKYNSSPCDSRKTWQICVTIKNSERL